MANTFKNYLSTSVGTSDASVYTAPSGTQSTVIGMTIANVTSSNINVSVKLTSGATTAFIVKDALIPVGGALVPIGGDQKVVLEAADVLKVVSDTAASADTVVSVLEIS